MSDAKQNSNEELKVKVHKRLLDTMDLHEARQLPVEQLYQECSRQIDVLLSEQNRPLSGPEKAQLIREVLDEVFGLGPIEEFLRDPMVSDILVNGSDQVFIEKFGVLTKTNARFRDNEQVLQIIQRIASQVGRRIDESSPMLDARLRDGSRVNAVIPPLSLSGPSLSIRRFGTIQMDPKTLVEIGTVCEEMAHFLQGCVRSRLNVLISGGTGSGKTTLLNVISRWVPHGERVVTIEDAAELQLQQDHVVRLETRPSNIEGKGEITQRSLLRNALRMRPDRIIIGEVRGAEALDMLQAMNTGHEGSMTTVHANSPRDAFMRIENMVAMAGLNFPVAAIRQQMSSAIDVLIHLGRLTGGRRRVLFVSEVTHMEGDRILLQDIMRFRQTGIGKDGHAQGHFEICGVRPQVLPRIEAEGFEFPEKFFHQRAIEAPEPKNGREVSHA
jgi:pilus assembly protein CpaF